MDLADPGPSSGQGLDRSRRNVAEFGPSILGLKSPHVCRICRKLLLSRHESCPGQNIEDNLTEPWPEISAVLCLAGDHGAATEAVHAEAWQAGRMARDHVGFLTRR